MTVGFLLVNLISLTLVLLIANHYTGHVIRNDFNRMSNDAASRFNFHMNQYFERVIDSTSAFVASPMVQHYLKNEQTQPEEAEKIEMEMRKLSTKDQSEITAMFLMSKQKKMISTFSYYYSRTEFYSNEPWFSLPYASEIQVIPTHFSKYPDQPEYAVISLMIPIFDVDSIEVIGRLILDIRPKDIRSTVGGERLGKSGTYFVVSSDEIIVYHPDPKWIGLKRSETPLADLNLSDENHTFYQRWNGEQWLISVNKSNWMNWNIVSIVPSYEMEEGMRAVQKAILLSFFIVSGIILTVVPFMTYQFVKRVITLKNLMGKAATGNLDVRAPTGGRQDEFQQLYSGFNHMVEQLQRLMETVYDLRMNEMKLELRQKEALILALQNQINPHLLYNTLGIIKSMAYLENVPKIETIAKNLADVYRYTAKFDVEEVTLRDELDILSKYLEIVKLRYPMTFLRTITVPEPFYDCRCMKLSLQPIVENAVKYAIEPNHGQGAIIVGAYMEESDLIIEIADNGKGFPEERLAQIQTMLKQATDVSNAKKTTQNSLGLSNVHARHVLKYGPRYGIRIDSFRDRGTVVSVRIPFRTTPAATS